MASEKDQIDFEFDIPKGIVKLHIRRAFSITTEVIECPLLPLLIGVGSATTQYLALQVQAQSGLARV